MSELELDLLKKGYQLGDIKDEGPCCGDDDTNDGYHCAWKIEAVKLPELPFDDAGLGGGGLGDGGLDFGALGTFTSLGKPGGASPLGSSKSPSGLAQTLGSAPSPMSLMPMMMSMVYPTLKPMLEASIRKLTVTVEWQGGGKGKSLDVVEYVTNPMQGGLDPNAANGLDTAMGALQQMLGIPTGAGTGTSGTGTAPAATTPSLFGGLH
jgi:general secretion pathway protein I